MKNLLIGFLCSIVFVGCASSDKLAYPTGKWVEVNPKGYIPENTTKYVKNATNGDIFDEVSK